MHAFCNKILIVYITWTQILPLKEKSRFNKRLVIFVNFEIWNIHEKVFYLPMKRMKYIF